jgi:tetratricopeptide (TPR) repeat protein
MLTIYLVVRNRGCGQAAGSPATQISTRRRKKCNAFLRKNKLCPRRKNRLQNAPMSRPRLIALLLALATLVAYLPVGTYSFVNYDDTDYVTENSFVKNGLTWPDIKWAFTAEHAGNWHPLTWLSHMLDCQLFGLNAGAHHFVNVLFHTANAVLLLVLLLRMTGGLWPSALTAALFAWHPLHVESVAWVAERKDVLSTFLALLALLAYVRYAKENRRSSFWLALFCFALGLTAKPMLVTLPFVMLLLDYWPLKRAAGRGFQPPTFNLLVFEKWPFILLSVISCIITFLAQRGGAAVSSLERVPLPLRLENMLVVYPSYLLKTIWPSRLAVIYPLPREISGIAVTAAAAVLIFISAAVWLARKRSPCLIVGWLWFLGTLVPVIGLVQVGSQSMADRYDYIPSIGIFIAAAFGAGDLISRFQLPKIAAASAAGLILAGCLVLTENQLRYWRDSESLFRHALAVTKDNDIAHLNLGETLQEKGDWEGALAEYRQAERLAPDGFLIHGNIASVLESLGRPEEAMAEYQEALGLNSNQPKIHDGLGIVLVEMNRFYEAMGQFAEAARLDPAYPWPHFQMGKALLKQGRDAGAVHEFQEALRLDPDNFQILAYTAQVLSADENPEVRDGQTALTYAARANILADGAQWFVLDALGMACAETGDFTHAVEAAQRVVELATAAKMKNLGPLQRRLQLYKNHQP